jgi:hypothetical protein
MNSEEALNEIVNSNTIELVVSSNVVFFMRGKNVGHLYVGFEGLSNTEIQKSSVIVDYSGKDTWEARVYCYQDVTDQQIEGMKEANSKGEFVWEKFIYPKQPYQFLGELDVDKSTLKAYISVNGL